MNRVAGFISVQLNNKLNIMKFSDVPDTPEICKKKIKKISP